MPCKYFGRGDRLNGLAQAHIVADQHPPSSYREQRALRLIRIKRRLQKRQQLGIGSAAWEKLLELRGPSFRIPFSGNEIERIVIGAELMTALRRHGHERLQLAKALAWKHAVTVGIE